MSASDYEICEARVLKFEGGYTNDPRDPGGPTNFGITIFDARKYWKPTATAEDVRAMPLSVAQTIYRSKYWDALNCDALPAGIDDTIFDYGVNSGIGRSGKVLRRVVGMPDNDWRITHDVLSAIGKSDAKAIIVAINDERLRFLQSLPTWPHFGGGWGKRVAGVKAFSLQLAAGAIETVPDVPRVPKGQIPKPDTRPITHGGGGAVVASGGLLHWLGAHPLETVLFAIGAAVLIALLVHAINRSHQANQEAPTPGLVPVTALTQEHP